MRVGKYKKKEAIEEYLKDSAGYYKEQDINKNDYYQHITYIMTSKKEMGKK